MKNKPPRNCPKCKTPLEGKYICKCGVSFQTPRPNPLVRTRAPLAEFVLNDTVVKAMEKAAGGISERRGYDENLQDRKRNA